MCRAVQHAHQKGVIHRDLKPANVLVTEIDDTHAPKVIDFGIAKSMQQPLTERTLFTQSGQVIGTPQYMSPEQAELTTNDVDTRSDVYALGIMLYELLTGTTPFLRDDLQEAAFDEMLRIIREDEPQKPSDRISGAGPALTTISENRKAAPHRLGTMLKGDLDWIVMKAIDKDRSRRYDGPSSLADDILRHLSHEPVLASPPSLSYRISRFVRKRQAAVVTALAFVFVLVAATAFSVRQAIIATRERNEKNDALVERTEALGKQRAANALANTRLAEVQQARRKADKLTRRSESHRLAVHAEYALSEAPSASLKLAAASLKITEDAGDPPTSAAMEAFFRASDSVGGRWLDMNAESPKAYSGRYLMPKISTAANERWLIAEHPNGELILWDNHANDKKGRRIVARTEGGAWQVINDRWLVFDGKKERPEVTVMDLREADPSPKNYRLEGYHLFQLVGIGDLIPDYLHDASAGSNGVLFVKRNSKVEQSSTSNVFDYGFGSGETEFDLYFHDLRKSDSTVLVERGLTDVSVSRDRNWLNLELRGQTEPVLVNVSDASMQRYGISANAAQCECRFSDDGRWFYAKNRRSGRIVQMSLHGDHVVFELTSEMRNEEHDSGVPESLGNGDWLRHTSSASVIWRPTANGGWNSIRFGADFHASEGFTEWADPAGRWIVLGDGEGNAGLFDLRSPVPDSDFYAFKYDQQTVTKTPATPSISEILAGTPVNEETHSTVWFSDSGRYMVVGKGTEEYAILDLASFPDVSVAGEIVVDPPIALPHVRNKNNFPMFCPNDRFLAVRSGAGVIIHDLKIEESRVGFLSMESSVVPESSEWAGSPGKPKIFGFSPRGTKAYVYAEGTARNDAGDPLIPPSLEILNLSREGSGMKIEEWWESGSPRFSPNEKWLIAQMPSNPKVESGGSRDDVEELFEDKSPPSEYGLSFRRHENSLIVWDLEQGWFSPIDRKLKGHRVDGHDAAIRHAVFSDEEALLTTIDVTGNVRQWDLTEPSRQSTGIWKRGTLWHEVTDAGIISDRYITRYGQQDPSCAEYSRVLELTDFSCETVGRIERRAEDHLDIYKLAPNGEWGITVDRTPLKEPLMEESQPMKNGYAPMNPGPRLISRHMTAISLAKLDWTRGSVESFPLDVESPRPITTRFSPNALWIATGRFNGQFRLWSLKAESLEHVSTMDLEQPVSDIVYSADSRFVAVLTGDQIRVWDLESERPVRVKLSDNTVVSGVVAMDSDQGSLLKVRRSDESTQTLNLLSGQSTKTKDVGVQPLLRHPSIVKALVPGKIAAEYAFENEVAPPSDILTESLSDVTAAAWRPQDQRLATGHDDGRIMLWDVRIDNPYQHVIRIPAATLADDVSAGRDRYAIRKVDFSKDGRQLIVQRGQITGMRMATQSNPEQTEILDIDPNLLLNRVGKVVDLRFSAQERSKYGIFDVSQ